MGALQNEIHGIHTLFLQLEVEVAFLLNNADFQKWNRMNFLTDTLKMKRRELVKKYPKDKLKKFNKLFDSRISTIHEDLSTLIEEKRMKSAKIKEQLKTTSNRKKIALYATNSLLS